MVNYNKARVNLNLNRAKVNSNHSKVKDKDNVNHNKVKARDNSNLNLNRDKDNFNHNKAKANFNRNKVKANSNLKDKANSEEEDQAQLVMSILSSAHLLLVVHQVPSHRVEESALLWRIIQTKAMACLQMETILKIKVMETMDSKVVKVAKVLRWR
jgi:hypothetical protein